MVEIRPLRRVDAATLTALIVGYTSGETYVVTKSESDERVRFELTLTPLERPLVERYTHLDEATIRRLQQLVLRNHSFGAFEGERCVGIGLADEQAWNGSLYVEEFHIAEDARGQGIGRHLMDALVAHARAVGLRIVVCETQTTNVPAIRFYRALGFTLDGVDVSLYSNDDLKRGEVAVYMKLPLDASQ